MTTTQRRVIAGLVGLTLVFVVVIVSTRAGRDGDERLAVRGRAERAPVTPAPDPTTPPEVAGATTIPLLPLTTGVPVPNAVQSPRPTAPPSATPATPGGAGPSGSTPGPATTAGSTPAGNAGAVLSRPADANTTRPVDKAKGCNSANDPGWEIEDCGALRSGGTVLLWLVETKGPGVRTLVLREQTAGRWAVVLAARDDQGKAFSSVGVRGEDVSGDGQPELVFGFHRRTADRTLAVDVVDAAPAVVVHRELPQGSARMAKGQLDTWAAAGDAFDHVVIRYVGGAWSASAPQRVTRRDVPPSMI